MAKTQVTYLPDGAVVVVFPSNLTIAMETGGHPILENQYRMHFKRKVIAPDTHVHRLEWRFYLRRKGRTKQSKIVDKVGRRMRVGPHFSRHANMHDSHEDGYKEKALLVCPCRNMSYLPSLSFHCHCFVLLTNHPSNEICFLVY